MAHLRTYQQCATLLYLRKLTWLWPNIRRRQGATTSKRSAFDLDNGGSMHHREGAAATTQPRSDNKASTQRRQGATVRVIADYKSSVHRQAARITTSKEGTSKSGSS
ncbi:hypothetical protein B5807_02727 [Epicoccum nigrum]|uniref:Uncharacterized protein n=1 Tax=Epicoccum nigrum TaxID=105696 RepID=A0A1Y2MA90_EPING|nr:hypothetical protein B5807_02727 [Epicoccum nigrum]